MLLFLLLLLLSPLHHVTASDTDPPPIYTPRNCSSQHMVEAVKTSSHCKPIVKVVKLEMPGNGSFTQMTPQFVEVNLCGGGCHTPSHSCVSTSLMSRQIPVLLSSCGLTTGLCSKSCATLTIEEDTACKCDCLQEQKICHNVRHSFNSQSCQCECKGEEEYTLCRDQGRVWDTEECVCRCPVELVKLCSTGFTYDFTSTSSCIPTEANNVTKLVSDERVERSDTLATNDKNYIEMVIIAAMAGIATIFFIIIISLLNSIKTLRRTIRSIREPKEEHTEESDQFLLPILK